MPGIRTAVAARRGVVVGVSGIVGGAPLAGMADRLMPAVGLEVTAAGAASAYEGLLGGWVIDLRDRALADRIEASGARVVVTDTVMRDDDAAERLADRAGRPAVTRGDVEVLPVEGLPEVRPGDDLAELIAPALAAIGIRERDVVVVTRRSCRRRRAGSCRTPTERVWSRPRRNGCWPPAATS